MSAKRIKRKPSTKEMESEILSGMAIDENGKPRISSTKLAKLLGVSHDEICRYIESHREELEELGPLPSSPIVN